MELNLEDFRKLKEKTKSDYDSVVSIYCNALKSDVVFNSDGWHHLRYDFTRSERSKKNQYNKFKHFNDSVDVIKKTMTIQEYRRAICPVGKTDKNGLRKTKIVEWFGFYAITSFSKRIRIMVVVRRIGEENGTYHYWSVMPYWNLSNKIRIIGSKDIEYN